MKDQSPTLTNNILKSEYRKGAARMVYVGPLTHLVGQEGYSWRSPSYNRLLFWPMNRLFSDENIYMVEPESLQHT